MQPRFCRGPTSAKCMTFQKSCLACNIAQWRFATVRSRARTLINPPCRRATAPPVRRTKHDGRSTRRAPPTLGLGRCSASLDWTVRAPFSVPCDLTLDSVAGAWEPREAWERLGNTKAGPGGSVGYGATRAKGPDHCRMSACPEPQRCEGLGGPGNKRDAFGLFCTAPARLGVGKWDSGLALAFIVACSVAGRWTGLDSPACPLLGRRTASGSGLELASRSAAADLVATGVGGLF